MIKTIITLILIFNISIANEINLSTGIQSTQIKSKNISVYGTFVNLEIDNKYQRFSNNIKLNINLDNKADQLDTDHIPVWFEAYLDSKYNLYNTKNINLDYLINVNWKMNTSSNIEQHLIVENGFGVSYNSDNIQVGLNSYAGYFYLEIDDDYPRLFGWERVDLANHTSSYSLNPYVVFKFNKNNDLEIFYQVWKDFQNKDLLKSFIMKYTYKYNNLISLSLKYKKNKYNLEQFSSNNLQPIMDFNTEEIYKLYFTYKY